MRVGGAEPMNPRTYARSVAFALTVLFLAANALVNTYTRGWRLDLTQDRLYTLSPGTRTILADLTEPVELTFYYSREAAAATPALRTYAARVREMLSAYAARSKGQLTFLEVEPVRFTEAEDEAVAAGIEPITLQQGGEPIYFGVAGANAADAKVALRTLDPEREPFLEYELTRLVSELENARRLKVEIITSLPLDPAAAATPNGGPPQPLFFTELLRAADVRLAARDFTTLDREADVLVLLQPFPLNEAQTYAVDQFILAKGRAFIAADPAALTWQSASPFDAASGVEASSDLSALLAPWGVAVSKGVVLDGEGALEVQSTDGAGRPIVAPQPLYIAVPADQLSREDLVTAGLQRALYFGGPGAITWTGKDGVTVTPLAQTSRQTMRIAAAQALARPGPEELIRGFASASRVEHLAVRITGTLSSAFAGVQQQAIAALPGDQRPKHLARSARPAEIVLVSDIDFLNDGFYVDEERTPTVDNGAFALNAIDLLGGSDALVSLRSRAPSLRPLETVEALRRSAQARLVETQERLRSQLAATESRLEALEAKGAGSGFFSGDLGAELSPEEREEMERFRAQAVQVRADLRAVERDYRRDLDALESRLVLLNVWLMPVLVAGAGLFLFWRRQRRADTALAPKKSRAGEPGAHA